MLLARLNKSLRADRLRSRDLQVNSFVKAEQYPAFKLPRAINGRVDYAKIVFGPIVKSIEMQVYKFSSFIKNVPVPERPRYIQDKISGPGTYFATDYTSFESSFTPLLCLAVEYEIYCYVCNAWIAEMICKAFYAFNCCVFQAFRIHVSAKRMSGDMNTSLGNGITNLVVILFIIWDKHGIIIDAIVIEGDDSLFRLPYGKSLVTEDFAQLGLNVKIDQHARLSTASFCGMVFDEVDMVNLADPSRILRRMGYFDVKYAQARRSKQLGLLRAWGFSMYYQYHGCPVIEAAALYALRVTRGVYAIMDSVNYYKFSENEKIPASEDKAFALYPKGNIGLGSRSLCQELYGLSVDEQLHIEAYFHSLNSIQPLVIPLISERSPKDTQDYFHACVLRRAEDPTHMQAPPRINFVKLVRTLNSRLVHINSRAVELSKAGIYDEDCQTVAACSCGLSCVYRQDLLHGLRHYLRLK